MTTKMSSRTKIKITFLALGIFWSGTMLTMNSFKKVNLSTDRDMYYSIFLACGAGLGLQKKSDLTAEEPKSPSDEVK
jgi:hypothetical protein